MANKFGAQLQKFAEQTGEDLADVDVGFKFLLFDDAVRGTPVDTGRLRGNWQITNGAPAAGTLDVVSDDQEGTPLDPAAELEIQPFSTTYMTNNLIYAVPMEINYGFVGRALANAPKRLDDAIRRGGG